MEGAAELKDNLLLFVFVLLSGREKYIFVFKSNDLRGIFG